MTRTEPSIDDYRVLLSEGHSAVKRQLRLHPNDSNLLAGLERYRQAFAIIDAMTEEEKSDPLDAVDSLSIRRLAQSAKTRDQDVMAFLFSYRDYCEQMLRLKHR